MSDDKREPTPEEIKIIADWMYETRVYLSLDAVDALTVFAPNDILEHFIEACDALDEGLLPEFFAARSCAQAMLAFRKTLLADKEEFARRWPDHAAEVDNIATTLKRAALDAMLGTDGPSEN